MQNGGEIHVSAKYDKAVTRMPQVCDNLVTVTLHRYKLLNQKFEVNFWLRDFQVKYLTGSIDTTCTLYPYYAHL